MSRPEVGQGHLGDRRILEEIVGAGATLQTGTEDQHLHQRPQKNVERRKPRKIAGANAGQSPGRSDGWGRDSTAPLHYSSGMTIHPDLPRRDGEATRQRLLRAALELYTTIGFRATTTPAIAARAGVAEGTIYRHFSGKEHLLNEVFRGAQRWGRTDRARDEGDQAPPRDRLQQMARRLLSAAASDAGHDPDAAPPPGRAALDERSREAEREFREALQQMVAGGKSDGVVRPGPADLWTDVWLALVAFVAERVAPRSGRPIARRWGWRWTRRGMRSRSSEVRGEGVERSRGSDRFLAPLGMTRVATPPLALYLSPLTSPLLPQTPSSPASLRQVGPVSRRGRPGAERTDLDPVPIKKATESAPQRSGLARRVGQEPGRAGVAGDAEIAGLAQGTTRANTGSPRSTARLDSAAARSAARHRRDPGRGRRRVEPVEPCGPRDDHGGAIAAPSDPRRRPRSLRQLAAPVRRRSADSSPRRAWASSRGASGPAETPDPRRRARAPDAARRRW